MSGNPKTIAFLTASPVWPFWLEKAAAKLLETENIQTIIHLYTPPSPPSRILKFCTALFRILEARSYNAAEIDAFRSVSSKIVQTVPIEDLLKHHIDIIICEGGICEGGICEGGICEGGICEGDIETLRASSCTSIWQFDENWSNALPVNAARAMLQCKGYVTLNLNDITKPETKTLYQTTSQVSSLSLNRTIHQHFLKAALIPLRALSGQTSKIVQQSKNPLLPIPWKEGLALSLKTFYRRVKQFLIKSSDTVWALGICKYKNGDPIAQLLKTMNRIVPPSDCFWADPFLTFHEGRHFLFFEEFEYAHGLGKIMVAEIDENGLLSEPVTVLSEPVIVLSEPVTVLSEPVTVLSEPVTVLSEPRHLSYPHVFQYNNHWYMVPETGESGRVDLYQALEFPYNWEHNKTLINGMRMFDATLYHYQKRWWLFGTIAEKEPRIMMNFISSIAMIF